jgi:5-methylthioadenosine/S-adenosylhomocysteine deaminase
VIENAAILTCGADDRFVPRGRIIVEDGRIARVEDAAAHAPECQSGSGDDGCSQRVNADGCIIVPGLINCHTHLWLSLLRGRLDDLTLFPWLRALAPHTGALRRREIFAATYFGIGESLRSGTTCLCECCRYAPEVTARVAVDLRCRVVVGGMPPSEWFGEPTSHDYAGLAQTTRETAEAHRREPLVSFWLGAHSLYNCSPAFLREAKRQATALGGDFYLHLAECRDEVDAVHARYGRTPVQHAADLGLLDARTVAVHCVWLTDDDLELFRQTGARMVHCPVSNAKLGSGVAPVTAYRSRGIAVGLGTDSAVSNNTLSMFQEMRFAVLLQRAVTRDAGVLTAAEALHMATIDAARALGVESQIGSLEPGKWADFVVVRATVPGALTRDVALSDVVYAAHRDDIEAVYVGGERVVERGRLTRIDPADLRARVREGVSFGIG